MTDSPSDSYLHPYREAVRRHGASFKATLWGTPHAQVARFDVMIDLADFDACTILDAGCGRGDFARRLIERDVEFTRYLGVDAVPEMVEAARNLRLPSCEFTVANVLDDPAVMRDAKADFICFSGTLNTMDDDTARRLVQEAFACAAQGVVFNFLSNRHHERWSGRDLTPARRFDTIAWIDWAMTRTSRVAFAQDYLDGHDATILIRHDG